MHNILIILVLDARPGGHKFGTSIFLYKNLVLFLKYWENGMGDFFRGMDKSCVYSFRKRKYYLANAHYDNELRQTAFVDICNFGQFA